MERRRETEAISTSGWRVSRSPDHLTTPPRIADTGCELMGGSNEATGGLGWCRRVGENSLPFAAS